MVYIDGCDFDRTTSASFIAALVARHANIIFGWNGGVRDFDGADTAQFMFDRLTGANDFEPQKPKTGFNQRPFDGISAFTDCSEPPPSAAHAVHCKSIDTRTMTPTNLQ
jgi:hypothetical protein